MISTKGGFYTVKIHTMYSCRTKDIAGAFKSTVSIYRSAVEFFINVCMLEWDLLSGLNSMEKVNMMKKLTVATKKRPTVKYDFSVEFYKFPSYLRKSRHKGSKWQCLVL